MKLKFTAIGDAFKNVVGSKAVQETAVQLGTSMLAQAVQGTGTQGGKVMTVLATMADVATSGILDNGLNVNDLCVEIKITCPADPDKAEVAQKVLQAALKAGGIEAHIKVD
jgi:hypothetical protein